MAVGRSGTDPSEEVATMTLDRRLGLSSLLLALALAAPASAQWTAAVTVHEPAGIRRTSYPTRLRVEVPEGRLRYVSQVRLMDGGTEIAAQGTAWSHWSDGSIRELEVDFNVSIGPGEERALELRYGPDVQATGGAPRGLVPTMTDAGIDVGRVKLHRVGAPLLSSVAYREELIGTGRNGITITERSGIRRDPREIVWEPVELLKSGPITVLARYRGRLMLSGGDPADITLDVEMPNSKSWVKISATVSDSGGRVGDLAIETPLRLGGQPWTWDFATPNHTYGAFRDPTGSAIYTRTVDADGVTSWEVRAGAAGSERPYEQGEPGDVDATRTWAHFVGPDEAVAFAVETSPEPGTLTMWLTGTGQTTVSFRSAEPATEHVLTVYEHYVATPVPIGAATSPASALSPLTVTVE
jgi:hypothetical protein